MPQNISLFGSSIFATEPNPFFTEELAGTAPSDKDRSDFFPGSAWPLLDELRLNPTELQHRQRGVGGSDVNIILSGDAQKILRLWQEKSGLVAPEDLSVHLPVMLGCWTEPFNRQWFERSTGYLICCVGAVVQCRTHDWRRCTLDGFIEDRAAVWEAKHTSAFTKEEDVLSRYMPQLQHNMAVTGSNVALLSVIYGNHKWEMYEIASDWLYQEELLVAESQFWNCVLNGVSPVPVTPPPIPKPVGTREICLEGSNIWAAAADDRTRRCGRGDTPHSGPRRPIRTPTRLGAVGNGRDSSGSLLRER